MELPRRAGAPRSLRGQLIRLVAALAIPLVALQVWFGYRELRSAQDRAGAQALAYANATVAGVRQYLAQTERLLRANAARLGLTYLEPATCERAVDQAVATTNFVNVMIVRADGTVVCSSGGEANGTSASDWGWFDGFLAGEPFILGEPIAGTFSDTWILPLVTGIFGQDEEPVAAVVGSLPLLQLADFIPSVDDADTDLVVTITDANGIVVAQSQEPEQLVGGPLPEVPSTREVSPGRWIGRYPDVQGVDRIWGRTLLGNGWSVYVGVPSATLYGPARSAAFRNVVVTVLILLCAITLAVLGYRRIAAALRHLTESLATAEHGGVLVSPPPDTPSEIHTVVERLNQTLRGRTAAEAAERASRERYQTIFDNAAFGIFLSTTDGRFLEVNRALVDMLGYDSADALVEAGPDALWPHAMARKELHRVAEAGRIEKYEATWLKQDGAPITVLLDGHLIRTQRGLMALEVIARDITEERRREDELRQSQKMEAIGKLAGGIAHDFNNLLLVIGGNVDLMETTLPKDHPLRRDLSEVQEAVERASSLTSQLLAFSRNERPENREADINEVITQMERMLGRVIGADIRLRTRLTPEKPVVGIDPREIEQIVLNLAVNARDAMPKGGDLTIETTPEARGIGPDESTDGVLLSVTDTGSGMDESVRSHIFEPFYTTKPVGEGTGLGLSMVYGIVQRAGGQTSVQSAPGEGTRIELWIPLAEPRGRGDTRAEGPAGAQSGSGTILVAEDEDLVRAFVERALSAAGFQVLGAADGFEALDLFTERRSEIDLVLTDVVMPGMRGPELARRIAALSPDTPVLFMSGYMDQHGLDKWKEEHPEMVLDKPFRAAELTEAVRDALERAGSQAADR